MVTTPQNVRILVVDDEPPLLRLMQTFLERLGYSVEGVTNATDALTRFHSDTGAFQLVVADLSLPDMSGDQMALQMVQISPNVRILLCSGYPFDVASLPGDLRNRFGTLQKPFLPNMLSQTVSELIGRP